MVILLSQAVCLPKLIVPAGQEDDLTRLPAAPISLQVALAAPMAIRHGFHDASLFSP
jgi:hypothetical protein